MSEVTIWVPGVARPQGSKRVYGGNVVDTNPAGLATFRADIRRAWVDQADDWVHPDATSLWLVFHSKRPADQFRADGTLKDWAPRFPTTRPDVDKLLRAILDALEGYAYPDDKEVVDVIAQKRFAEPIPGVGTTIIARPA